jgi:hypothetical protein
MDETLEADRRRKRANVVAEDDEVGPDARR